MESVRVSARATVKFSPIIIISRDLSNVKSIWQIFFASNFEACACTAINTVSNFHISWKLEAGSWAARQIFKLMGAAILVKFSYTEAASPRQILYAARSCNSCIFARPPIKLEHKQYAFAAKFEFIRKIIIIIIIIIIPLLLYNIFKKISNLFRQ